MSINPAGLGMYRHGDISITPMMSFARSKGNARSTGRNSRDRFSMANIGVVINAYEGSRSLISLNVGFGYNRIADFNYDYGFVQAEPGRDHRRRLCPSAEVGRRLEKQILYERRFGRLGFGRTIPSIGMRCWLTAGF